MRRTGSTSGEPIEHPPPSDTTVKRLYATAFGCCKPGCGQPLFRQNEATGAWLLNSRVAHIHARREGGPRWDPHLSDADNRSYDNLLLLCIPHAAEIDDTPEHYPADLLRSWKQAELDNYERYHRSWTLSDDKVAEVAAASFDPQPLLEQIAATLPFSPRMRSRADALARATAKARAKRAVRLAALLPPDRVDDVVTWMANHRDPAVRVPEGQLRVLVAPMGAGKSEQALRWLEEALHAAGEDAEVEIPVWLAAREISGSLESVVTAAIGGDPVKACRIVIDDLDSISPKQADYLLNDARELVQIWPRVSVLATSRPGVPVNDQELLRVDPWPAERGADLLHVLVGERVPWGLWSQETVELLESPLSVLALAARLNAGGDARVSRLQLLADLAETIIWSRHSAQATDETWHDLARLAARVLEGPGPVRAASFGTEPRVRQLAATDLVVNDGGVLTFALPLFEQHFGAQAIASSVVALESAASPATFPRWRYALAFAVATSEAPVQEQLMIRLARVNPAAALWILGEVAPGDAHTAGWTKDLTDTAIVAMIKRRRGAGEGRGGGRARAQPRYPRRRVAPGGRAGPPGRTRTTRRVAGQPPPRPPRPMGGLAGVGVPDRCGGAEDRATARGRPARQHPPGDHHRVRLEALDAVPVPGRGTRAVALGAAQAAGAAPDNAQAANAASSEDVSAGSRAPVVSQPVRDEVRHQPAAEDHRGRRASREGRRLDGEGRELGQLHLARRGNHDRVRRCPLAARPAGVGDRRTSGTAVAGSRPAICGQEVGLGELLT